MSIEERMEPHDHGTEQLEGLTLAEAALFAKKALREVRADEVRARCIDGRYPEGAAALAMPGGDAGLFAAGLGVANRLRNKGITIANEAVRDAVFAVIGGKKYFNYHTDTHAEEQGSPTKFAGCGHCRLLTGDPASYVMDEEQADFFKETLAQLYADGVKPDVLQGGHEERAVFIVNAVNNPRGRAWALDGQAQLGAEGTAQAFVYQSDLANRRFAALAKAMAEASGNEEHVGQIEEDLKKIGEIQLRSTANELAKGKPVYVVTIDGESGKFTVVRQGEEKAEEVGLEKAA